MHLSVFDVRSTADVTCRASRAFMQQPSFPHNFLITAPRMLRIRNAWVFRFSERPLTGMRTPGPRA